MKEYAEKRASFIAAQQEIEQLSSTIASVARALQRNAERFAFTNAPGTFPPEAIMSRDSVSIDGNTWPTAAEMNEKLVKLHSTRSEMDAAWSRLSVEQKSAMQPPPSTPTRPPRY